VTAEASLEALSSRELSDVDCLIHGTYRKSWELIREEGLSRMKRNHIHLARGIPGVDEGVISGMRKNCEVFIYVDGKACADDGVVFYKSDNGVVLTAGVDESGILPTKYFLKVVDVSSGKILFEKNVKVN